MLKRTRAEFVLTNIIMNVLSVCVGRRVSFIIIERTNEVRVYSLIEAPSNQESRVKLRWIWYLCTSGAAKSMDRKEVISLSLSLSLSLLSLHSPTLSTRCAGPTFEVYYMYIECVPSRVSVHYVYSVYVY